MWVRNEVFKIRLHWNKSRSYDVCRESQLPLGSTILLNFRLHQRGLQPLDVGGTGDCFLELILINYMVTQKVTYTLGNSLLHIWGKIQSVLLKVTPKIHGMNISTNITLQGSWPDTLMVQAVTESQNLRIHIAESNENFTETTVIRPLNLSDHPSVPIYLGHSGEIHYVSTLSYTCRTQWRKPKQSWQWPNSVNAL